MANVAGQVGVAEQIRLVAGLRWRILRNHIRRKNNWLDLIGMIAAAFWAGVLIIGVSFAFYCRRRKLSFHGSHRVADVSFLGDFPVLADLSSFHCGIWRELRIPHVVALSSESERILFDGSGVWPG